MPVEENASQTRVTEPTLSLLDFDPKDIISSPKKSLKENEHDLQKEMNLNEGKKCFINFSEYSKIVINFLYFYP